MQKPGGEPSPGGANGHLKVLLKVTDTFILKVTDTFRTSEGDGHLSRANRGQIENRT